MMKSLSIGAIKCSMELQRTNFRCLSLRFLTKMTLKKIRRLFNARFARIFSEIICIAVFVMQMYAGNVPRSKMARLNAAKINQAMNHL